ncbi:hypothetical protein LTR15_006295 [Elasticomyces elasticus]|nr:hypothetical protein LTR15_006295 [Elasticomyces elasticus]
MASNHVSKVAIVGAGGNVGRFMTEALLKTGKHDVTALTREDSQSKLLEGVKTKIVDYSKPETLVDALRGQDALVIIISGCAPIKDIEEKLVRAAAEADVKWIGNTKLDSGDREELVRWSITTGRDIGITSWAGFGLYEMSFGEALGQPTFVRPPYMQIDSAAIVLPRKRAGFDEEDRDAIEVMLMLRKDDIEALQQDSVWQMLAPKRSSRARQAIPRSPQAEIYAPYVTAFGQVGVPMV